ncbi:hypothetical protein [Pseudofrankia sp. BMG5.37]|uniref:restriction system modified-DNA reader domain-containing protein n=1 Tax=Pseudofrankia sp. BMG5.37 TaxID=3050035 RepID=UPI000AC7F82D
MGGEGGDGGNDVAADDDGARPRRQRCNATPADLIDAGRLRAGERLVGSRRGRLFPATVTADGRIRTASGEIHRSPSAAAKAATGASNRATGGSGAWNERPARCLKPVLSARCRPASGRTAEEFGFAVRAVPSTPRPPRGPRWAVDNRRGRLDACVRDRRPPRRSRDDGRCSHQ